MIALVERYLMMAVPLDVRNLRGIGFREGAGLQTRAVPFSFHCTFFSSEMPDNTFILDCCAPHAALGEGRAPCLLPLCSGIYVCNISPNCGFSGNNLISGLLEVKSPNSIRSVAVFVVDDHEKTCSKRSVRSSHTFVEHTNVKVIILKLRKNSSGPRFNFVV